MKNRYKVDVFHVVDGDTFYGHLRAEDIQLTIPDQRFRFLGVDTPERGEEGYQTATDFTEHYCENKTVEVEVYGKDVFGRWLVKVIVGQVDFNKLLLDKKLAVVYTRK